jgi:hypothetical protein
VFTFASQVCKLIHMTSTKTPQEITPIQLGDDFIGVAINNERAGHVARHNEGWLAVSLPSDVGTPSLNRVFTNTEDAINWIASKF